MYEPFKTIKYKGLVIEIHTDMDPMNPRKEFDNLTTMVCYHPNYDLGDKNEYLTERGQYSSFEDLASAIEKKEGPIVWLPLFLYDHSGITISTGNFANTIDPGAWDTSRIGIVFVSYKKLRKEYGWKLINKQRIAKAVEYIKGEVETYDDYLTGDVFGYIIKNSKGDELDSACWGFYGWPDKSGIIEEAKAAADAELKYAQKKHNEKLKAQIKAKTPLNNRVSFAL